jgi:hypothetical protein
VGPLQEGRRLRDFQGARLQRWIAKRQITVTPSELHKYLVSSPADIEVNVLQWWKMHGVAHPRLAEVARDYLAIPATGAPVERVFSGGTDMVLPKHGRLAADTIRACLCLRNWLGFTE